MPVKVLLDTDIGSDIDDAVCLAYLLAQPQCELLGITTVSGEVNKRAMMASALCKVAGKKIPVFPGVEEPLIVAQKQKTAQQAKALEKWDHDRSFPKGEAIDFLRQTIRKYPGEVVLLAIGPLTNIALLFSVDPEIPYLIKSMVLMCGVFTSTLPGVGPLEWNAVCDPHAAAIVYNACVADHYSVGLDVTCQVKMDSREVRERFRADLLRPVLDFAEIWFEHGNVITFHDPLAAAAIFDPGICTFSRGTVDVELVDEKLTGMTRWKPDDISGVHRVALEVDSRRFFSHYFSVYA